MQSFLGTNPRFKSLKSGIRGLFFCILDMFCETILNKNA